MKKIFIILAVIVILIFSANKVYQLYSRNNINSHESIILINNHLFENEIDAFFSLEKGTYNSQKHKIVFSLLRKDGYLLDSYINLPVKNNTGTVSNNGFDCNIKYEEVRAYGFYNYEIGNRNIIARIITKDANSIMKLSSNEIVSERWLSVNYEFGKMNVLDIEKNGFTSHCE